MGGFFVQRRFERSFGVRNRGTFIIEENVQRSIIKSKNNGQCFFFMYEDPENTKGKMEFNYDYRSNS